MPQISTLMAQLCLHMTIRHTHFSCDQRPCHLLCNTFLCYSCF